MTSEGLTVGSIKFGPSWPAALPAADRAARIANPRGALDILYEARRITRQEYETGLFFGQAATNGGRAAMMVYRSMWEVLERVEIDYPPMLIAVCVQHKTPKTEGGITRLRKGLQLLASHLAEIETEMDLPTWEARPA